MIAPRIDRLPALLALALPVLAGLAYQLAFGAPEAFVVMNFAALVIGIVWIALAPESLSSFRPGLPAWACFAVLLGLLALPLLTGPEVNGVRRWLPFGVLPVHAGMLALPLLLRLAARHREDGVVAVPGAILIALLQPDAGSAAGLTFGAIGLYHVAQDWRIGVIAAAGFFATIFAALRGELAPQPFVERVLVDAAFASLPMAIALLVALGAGFAAILFAVKLPRAERFAIGGTLFGFTAISVMNTYPTPLLGFGAAPIIGYALALTPARSPSA